MPATDPKNDGAAFAESLKRVQYYYPNLSPQQQYAQAQKDTYGPEGPAAGRGTTGGVSAGSANPNGALTRLGLGVATGGQSETPWGKAVVNTVGQAISDPASIGRKIPLIGGWFGADPKQKDAATKAAGDIRKVGTDAADFYGKGGAATKSNFDPVTGYTNQIQGDQPDYLQNLAGQGPKNVNTVGNAYANRQANPYSNTLSQNMPKLYDDASQPVAQEYGAGLNSARANAPSTTGARYDARKNDTGPGRSATVFDSIDPNQKGDMESYYEAMRLGNTDLETPWNRAAAATTKAAQGAASAYGVSGHAIKQENDAVAGIRATQAAKMGEFANMSQTQAQQRLMNRGTIGQAADITEQNATNSLDTLARGKDTAENDKLKTYNDYLNQLQTGRDTGIKTRAGLLKDTDAGTLERDKALEALAVSTGGEEEKNRTYGLDTAREASTEKGNNQTRIMNAKVQDAIGRAGVDIKTLLASGEAITASQISAIQIELQRSGMDAAAAQQATNNFLTGAGIVVKAFRG
jgi:hypothetical protein